MPKTVPNQRVIRVHRERASSDFLGIKNERWMAASRTLGATALRLYLYKRTRCGNDNTGTDQSQPPYHCGG